MAKLGEAISAAAWGEEILKGDTDGTSEENETSIVQFSDVYERKVLLTGDAGVRALTEAHQAAVAMGKSTSELDWFQVPHHGSRRNLSSDVLDTWLGGKLTAPTDSTSTHAIISANQKDTEHPKKAVVRAVFQASAPGLDGFRCSYGPGPPAWTPEGGQCSTVRCCPCSCALQPEKGFWRPLNEARRRPRSRVSCVVSLLVHAHPPRF